MTNKKENLPAISVTDSPANAIPAKVVTNHLLEILEASENINDSEFTEIQNGEFVKWEEGEIRNFIFAGFEELNDKSEGIKKAAIFYDGEQKKLIDTHIALVSKCEKIHLPVNIYGIVVRIVYLGKVKSTTNPAQSYSDFRVSIL